MRAFSKQLLLALVLFTLTNFFSACESDSEIDIDGISLNTDIERFDRSFFQMDTTNFSENLEQLEKQFPPFFSAKTEMVFWENQRMDEVQLELFAQTEKLFGDFQKESEEINRIFKRYFALFGLKDTFKVYTYISRLDYDYPIIVAPPYTFIALDMYLGEANKYYGQLPNYLQFRRQPKFLLRDLAFALVENAVASPPEGNTLLEAMVYHGKLLYLTEQLAPFLLEDELMVYPIPKLQFCLDRERDMWVYFVEQNLLFNSSTELQRRFIDLGPFSKFRTDMDMQTPGSVGRWFGYRIVKSFMSENPNFSWEDLLAEKDAAKILKLSAYKP